jgi:lysozyme family protein
MESLIDANTRRWKNCQINQDRLPEIDKVVARLTSPSAKARYKTVEKATGVPWWFVAVVHEREASQNWNSNLGQGDPWSRVSTHVPVGRGPFNSWEEAAIDALVACPPYSARNKDWSVGSALAHLERYNGLGYYNRGEPSPYVWAGTNQYVSGKFIADHVYSPTAVDHQLGCAALLKRMAVLETVVPSIGTKTVIIAGGAVAASQAPHLWPYILAGVGIALALEGMAWFIYRNWRN